MFGNAVSLTLFTRTMTFDRLNASPGRILRAVLLPLCLLALLPPDVSAQTDADSSAETRLLRFPDIHQDQIVFVYGGDIWIVSARGGTARRLTSHIGQELFPKFSPDGRWIAFSAEYSGSRQIYVVPAAGGEPRQLTWYNDVGPMPPRGGWDHQVLGWTPDGTRILFRGNRVPWSERQGRYFTVPLAGGLETALPIPEGGSGEYSPDGTKFVYTPIEREFRTWKRTRGGRAQDVWIFDLARTTAERITDHVMTDNMPLWIGDRIYFTSDRDFRLNIFSYDPATRAVEKITTHDDADVLWPSSGPGAIVYQCGGRIWVWDAAARSTRAVPIVAATDAAEALPAFKNVAGAINSAALSPSGKRALFEARGDLFTVPAKHGEIRNLTRTPGVRELTPTWSPDGSTIAYLSDESGEYELYIRNADGTGTPRRVTTGNDTWLFAPVWSPDGRKIAIGDKRQRLRVVDVATGRITDVARGIASDITSYAWSPDSRWIAYTNAADSKMTAIFAHCMDDGRTVQLGSGLSNDYNPVFSADGRYLFFLSNRDFSLTFSAYEFTYVYTAATRVYVAPLQATTPSFFPVRSDEEPGTKTETRKSDAKSETTKSDAVPRVEIDAAGFADRVMALPGAAADYSSLRATKSAVFYIRSDREGRKLLRYDIEKQKEEDVLSGIGGWVLSHDGSTILYTANGRWGICEAKPAQKSSDGLLTLSSMDMRVDPRAEWSQMYIDAWRLMRDWFYDPKMHGTDWSALRDTYGALVPHLRRRSDLDFILGELIGELNAGHTYVNSGDEPRVPRRDGGLLGCEFEDDGSAYYRIAKIFRGENWHEAFRSPLTEPGMNVKAGDYLIAIDGRDVRRGTNPWMHLENLAGRSVQVTVNTRPTPDGARTLTVRPVKSEQDLRFLEWVRRNREWVDSASGGRIGYIWIPNTAQEGNRELFKWFYPQARKEALIIDDRYNGGGFIPYNMIALLEREALNYWARRGVEPFSAPDVFHEGPKACLINGYSSSGGDAFPWYFRKKKLGPLIGTRTWGGLIGLTGNPSLMDGGSLSIPTFRFFDTDGKWQIENEGVSPDIEVIDRPDLVAKGQDPSLEKALEVLMEELRRNPVRRPQPPVPPDESK
jgi:tricorn protease